MFYADREEEARIRHRVKDSACKDCLFWRPDKDDKWMGECRRRPPVRDGWPSTCSDDWCGEFLWRDVP